MEEKSVEDHISKLPVPTLQNFLSLLLAKDAAQISTFSKTWYASWTYLSYLNFGDEFFDPEEDDRRILSEKYHSFSYNVHNWIKTLVASNIKKLILKVDGPGDSFNTLSKEIFVAEGLRVLDLSGFDLELPPDGIKFSSLRKLRLSETYLNEQFVRALCASCRGLEDLSCSSFELQTIKIASDRLEYLALSCQTVLSLLGLKQVFNIRCVQQPNKNPTELPTLKLMKASVLLEVELDLFSGERLDSHWYSMLMIFLGNFKQSKAIDLICNKAEAIVIPKDMRKNLVPPLYGSTGSLHIKFQSWENYSLVDVFDSLLWISPQCDTLSFVRVSELNSTLKLIYENASTEENFLEAC
ncbi:hypothetical protein RND71_005881 [Anisodus tanguticus]|uniref:F-box/LRR-repeat protein 15/At3g58940/PEG3-like LRR domain-containing protein n=1 Tax=Anisodus tanguticus TaxID=243964 RepID=A0AAE1VVB6_9SOLA|nr:hypothetical protein RND71_005881 [Anisodus tanguticus]